MADTPQEIPLGDLEIAEHIAASARSGRPVDRTPTLEQLLAAFAEPAPTPAARERVAAALRVAGIATTPDVRLAEPGSRVKLEPGGATPGRVRRALAGVLALVVLLGGAALAAVVLGGGDPDTAADLPATSTTTTSTATTQTTPTATASTPAATTRTTTVGTVTTATTTKPARKTPRKKKRKKRRTPTTVRVALAPGRPTYLCVTDGAGRALFSGTLSAPQVFRAKVVRINVGLGPSTVLQVDGKPIPMEGSPAGYELRTGGRITPLPTGQRPEC